MKVRLDFDSYVDILNENVIEHIENYAPKVLGALIILGIGMVISWLVYKFLLWFFRKINLNEFIDKFKINLDEESLQEKGSDISDIPISRLTDKIKIDKAISKSVSYYIILVFFRIAITYIGITTIEEFLRDVIGYLPNLFIGVLIGFFGIRFANFIHDLVFHTLSISKDKTAKIIAEGARIIILFFTLLVFLDYIQIVSMFIINTILIGFVSMLAISGGLAFGLGGREIAKDILESFRK